MIRPHVREKRLSRNSESAFTHTAIKRSNLRIILVSHEEYQGFQLKRVITFVPCKPSPVLNLKLINFERQVKIHGQRSKPYLRKKGNFMASVVLVMEQNMTKGR